MWIIYLNHIHFRDGNICYLHFIWYMQNIMKTPLVIMYNHEKETCTSAEHETNESYESIATFQTHTHTDLHSPSYCIATTAKNRTQQCAVLCVSVCVFFGARKYLF